MTKEQVLSEKTTVSIGLIVILIGGILYVTNVHFESQANAVAIRELQKQSEFEAQDRKEIIERLARIEGKLEGYKKWTSKRDE